MKPGLGMQENGSRSLAPSSAQIMADPTAGGFTEGGAFHCYGGDASAIQSLERT